MIQEPNCFARRCKHFLGCINPSKEESGEWVNCKAFPDGIPVGIAFGAIPHDRPYPGDGGIRYEKGARQ